MIRKVLVIGAVCALLATACGTDDSGASPPSTLTTTSTAPSTEQTSTTTTTTTVPEPDDGFPVTVQAPNGAITIEERPERIVSISPTSTEVLFAIGAGDQVVAVDSLSNHPPSAPMTDLTAFTPNLEAIVGYEPDLVFLSFDPNGDLIPGLDALGIPVILHSTAMDLADAYAQWEQTGTATGHAAEAEALVAETRAAIDSALAEVPAGTMELSYYYELDPSLFSVTSMTFVGEVIAGTGLVNIADDADPDGFGYPQLSSEFVIGVNPTLILLADTKCCGQSASTVAERPGWGVMTAVSSGHIVELDDDIASRWGPRIADLVEDVVVAILQVELEDT